MSGIVCGVVGRFTSPSIAWLPLLQAGALCAHARTHPPPSQVDRLVALYCKYMSETAKAAAADDAEADEEEEEEEDEEDDEEDRKRRAALRSLRLEAAYLRRLGSGGLAALQQASAALARLVLAPADMALAATPLDAPPGFAPVLDAELKTLAEDVAQTTHLRLYEQGGSLADVVAVLTEWAERMASSPVAAAAADAAAADFFEAEKEALLVLATRLSHVAGGAAGAGKK